MPLANAEGRLRRGRWRTRPPTSPKMPPQSYPQYTPSRSWSFWMEGKSDTHRDIIWWRYNCTHRWRSGKNSFTIRFVDRYQSIKATTWEWTGIQFQLNTPTTNMKVKQLSQLIIQIPFIKILMNKTNQRSYFSSCFWSLPQLPNIPPSRPTHRTHRHLTRFSMAFFASVFGIRHRC